LQRAEDRAARSQKIRRRRDGARYLHGRRLELRETEVEQLRAGLRKHDVAGLEIAVRDALAVRAVERLGDLDAVAQHLRERHRAAREPLRGGFSFEQLHDDVLDAILAADVVERADVRMVEARDRLRLALESLPEVGVARDVLGEDLDRDGAFESCVASPIDLAHAACADQGEDLVRPEAFPGGERHEGWIRSSL